MKLSCVTFVLRNDPLESVVRKLNDTGFGAIEIVFEYPFFYGDNYLDQQVILKKLKQELAIEYSVHAPFSYEFYSHIDPVFRKYLHKMVDKSAKLANYIDSDLLVIHGGLISSMNRHSLSREKSVELFLNEIKPLVRENPDLKICLENLNRKNSIGQNLEECKNIFQQIPQLGFCFDIPHAHVAGNLQQFMDSDLTIDHVHITDTNREKDQHWSLGKGEIDWRQIKDYLKKKNFNGHVVLENPTLSDAVESLNYWNNL